MASQFLIPSQVFQSPFQSNPLNSRLFIKFNSRRNYNGDSTSIQAGKQLPLSTASPSGVNKSLVYRIRALCSNTKIDQNDLDEAERVLNTMLENGLHPDPVTLTILINSFCKRGRMKKGLEIFDLMNRIGSNPTVQTYNCLLKGLCYVGKVEEAYEMLMNMKKKKKKIPITPDIYSYTTVMDGLCKVGRSDEAKELLEEAEVKLGLKPNVITFNTLFQGYSREGRPLEGISVLNLMKKKSCVPDSITYSTLLHGLLKWNKIDEALSIYREMERLGFDLDVRMMGTLVRRLCRESRRERGVLEDAYQVFEKMTQRESMVDLRTLEVMIQALCAQGKTEEAVTSFVWLYENGRFPNRLCFEVVIKKLKAQGRVFCAFNLFGAAMKLGVAPIKEPLHNRGSRIETTNFSSKLSVDHADENFFFK